jgi:hypothetical protein
VNPEIYTPAPITPAAVYGAQPASVVLPQQPMQVAYAPGPNGLTAVYVPAQTVTIAPAVQQPTPAPPAAGPAVHPLLVNAFLGAGTFALAALGLHLLAATIEALAHLMMTLVILAAILCAAPVVLQLLRGNGGGHGTAPQTVIHARRVVIRRLVNKGGR